MDAVGIGVVIFVVLFMVVGLVAAHFATKASQKDADEINKLQKK